MQPDQLDEPLDLRLCPTQAQVPAGLAQALGHHGEVDHQRGVSKNQLVKVDENRVIRVQGPGHRRTSQALSGPVFVSHAADHRWVFAVGDDGGYQLTPYLGLDSRAMPSPEDVEAALTNVIDPELGLDFVELGLIYGIEVSGGDVHVTFSLTSPGCPIGPQVSEQIEEFVTELDGVTSVESTMTFSPPWTPDRMSEDAKFALGY